MGKGEGRKKGEREWREEGKLRRKEQRGMGR